jgi:hypothetical protein
MTAQIHELLLLDGEWASMASEPALPRGHPRVAAASEEAQKAASPIIFSTACWRRYRGTWEVRDGRLSLIALEGLYELKGEGPLPAEWVTAVLNVPRGKMLEYVHMGYASVFEEELHIRIERGVVTGRSVVDNRGRVPKKK